MNRSRRALSWGAPLAIASLILTLGAAPLFVGAADHLDAPSLGHVSVDSAGNVSVEKLGGQLDINDLYVFKSATAGMTTLAMTVNPAINVLGSSTFASNSAYTFNIDTTGDARADHRYVVTFGDADARGIQHYVVKAAGADKEAFNHTAPADQPTAMGGKFRNNMIAVFKALSALSGNPYTDAEAAGFADLLLPDVLTYTVGTPAAGPLNGRGLGDDVIDFELNLVTRGAVPTDMVYAHTDYLASFPYLGNPH